MALPYELNGKPRNSWFTSDNSVSRIMGFSFIASLFQADAGATGQGTSYLMNSVRLFLLGTVIEGGRRLFGWAMDRFQPFQYSISAHFTEGDPAYEWITLFLTEEKIWNRSRKFRVNSRSSIRQWTVDLDSKIVGGRVDEHVEFVPKYDAPQLFWWKGYWTEVKKGGGNNNNRTAGTPGFPFNMGEDLVAGELSLTLYTRDMGAMSALVEDARQRYVNTSRPHVIVHTAVQGRYNGASIWGTAKRKARRPLSSIILQEGVIKSLVDDAHEFFKSEDWYAKAGIPHRRGYLLHGPPGTGKSSTIYAVAGELGMEIYSLSLSSEFVDDAFLERAVSAIPKHSILLIEDIDCAFPSREDGEDDDMGMGVPMVTTVMRRGIRLTPRAQVTLSGLLNVLDGVGSEEGKIFFATTNYIDRLDPALLRPGRIDKKLQYKLATQAQAAALFMRFYPESPITLPPADEKRMPEAGIVKDSIPSFSTTEKNEQIRDLSQRFAASVPQHEFSTAELQGFLLSCKHEPSRAVEEIGIWVEQERAGREERVKKEVERKEKVKGNKQAREGRPQQGGSERLGVPGGGSGSPKIIATPLAPHGSLAPPILSDSVVPVSAAPTLKINSSQSASSVVSSS